jgi:hypothetical protein
LPTDPDRTAPGPRHLFWVLAVFILATPLASCSTFGENETGQQIGTYFPLQVGNMWAYQTEETTDSGEHWVDTVRVFGTAEIDDDQFFLYGREGRPWYLREGEHNRVMRYHWAGYDPGRDIPWLLFDLQDATTYSYPDSSEWGYTVTVSQGLRVETPAGVFEYCTRFDFYRAPPIENVLEDSFFYTLAPNVGIVAWGDEWSHWNLTGFVLSEGDRDSRQASVPSGNLVMALP